MMEEPVEVMFYPDRARKSCWALHQSALVVDLPATFDSAAAVALADRLDVKEVQQFGSSLANGLTALNKTVQVESIELEVGLICFMHALDFGGGWRQELHQRDEPWTGKGAWATIKPGVEAIFEENPKLPASELESIQQESVEGHFGLSGYSSLAPLALYLTKVIQEIGSQLKEHGWCTLSEFVMSCVKKHVDEARPAALLVHDLVETFPFTFNDRHNIASFGDVFFYKKAQLVVGELYHRFRQEDVRFDFRDGHLLTAFIDNVICAVLCKDGVVVTSSALRESIDAHEAIHSGSEAEVSLRAAAMIGVEELARLMGLAPVEVGNYLWGCLGKKSEYRCFTRHATKDTVFY